MGCGLFGKHEKAWFPFVDVWNISDRSSGTDYGQPSSRVRWMTKQICPAKTKFAKLAVVAFAGWIKCRKFTVGQFDKPNRVYPVWQVDDFTVTSILIMLHRKEQQCVGGWLKKWLNKDFKDPTRNSERTEGRMSEKSNQWFLNSIPALSWDTLELVLDSCFILCHKSTSPFDWVGSHVY